MIRLEPSMVERFREDGFLSIETGLTEDDIAGLRKSLAALHDENVGFDEGALFDAAGVDDGSTPARFPQILHPRSFAPELIGNRFYQQARVIAEQLLGSEVRFKADISLMKPARSVPRPHGTRMRLSRILRSTMRRSVSGWRCNRSISPTAAWPIFQDPTKGRCFRTGFRGMIRVSTRWNVLAASTRKTPCPVRCRPAVASSTPEERYMARGPTPRMRRGWPTS